MTVSNELIDSLLVDYKKPEDLIGENGLLKQLTKRLVERFAFCLALCCSTGSFASDWEQFSISADGQESFTDYSRIKKDAYGLQTFRAWWQTRLPSARTIGGKKFRSVLYLFRVDCGEASMSQISANYYDASDIVIHADNSQYRPSIVLPDSSGEAFVQAICAVANGQAKPTKLVSNASTATNNLSLKDAITTLASTSSTEPPVPEFKNAAARLSYLKWLDAMGEKLNDKMPGWKIREFLQTVWFESRRSGLDDSLVLGLIESLSGFHKFSVLENGARGYMAIMPGWSRKIGDGDVGKLFHEQTNMRFGMVILRNYLDQRQGILKAALLDYVADSFTMPRTDPRVLQKVEEIVMSSQKWRLSDEAVSPK